MKNPEWMEKRKDRRRWCKKQKEEWTDRQTDRQTTSLIPLGGSLREIEKGKREGREGE